MLEEEPFESISFYKRDIGDFVRWSEHENFVFDEQDSRQFNITVDIAYAFHYDGIEGYVTKIVPQVPIFRKFYIQNKKIENDDDKINEHECKLYYRGQFSADTDECIYYMQARKICLVLDQDSKSYDLVPNYENFKCDFINHNEDFVMWSKFRWYKSQADFKPEPIEPTLKDLDVNNLQFEFFVSHEPTVQTLFNMNVHLFDVRSVS